MNKNEVICCFGDSITAAGLWCGEVFEQVAKKGARLYNCGVSGDTATLSLKRIYSDLISYSPTTVLVMFGINDVSHWIYPREDADTRKFIDSLILRHKESLEKIINIVSSTGAQVVLCDPVPYMEDEGFDSNNNKCNSDLDKVRENIYALAEKYNLDVIKIHDAILEASKKDKVINEDRIHPNEKGHHVIAQTVLQYLGLIDKPDEKSTYEFAPANQERLDVEKIYKEIMFMYHSSVEMHCLVNHITFTGKQRRDFIENSINSPNQLTASRAKLYAEYADSLLELRGKIIEKTIEAVNYFTEVEK